MGTTHRGVLPSRTTRTRRRDDWLSSPKLALPSGQGRSVLRNGLLERLAGASGGTVITIVAPAGYGKTTLLQQWAQPEPRVAYVRLDPADNDPTLLVAYIAAALDRSARAESDLTSVLASPRSIQATLLPRLTEAIWRLEESVVLMLDDVHVIERDGALDALSWLATRLPPMVRLAVAGRHVPDIPLARLRTEGRLLEIGARGLALDEQDVVALASMHDVELAESDARDLVERTEGWPAAIYLSVLAIKAGSAATGKSLRGDSASLADYMREELLAPLEADEQRWLARSSALETLTGPLCDAALETTGSLARLRALERSNLFLLPLDDHRASYRFHHLFAEFLGDELDVREPGAAAEIKRRASVWYEEHGDIERAVEYAHDGGDMDAVARLMGRFALRLFWHGRLSTLGRWLGWFDQDDLRARWAPVATLAGWIEALQGHTRNAERWLAAAQRSADDGPMPDGTATKGPWVALLRGGMITDGVAAAVGDARAAREGIAPDGFWWPSTLMLQVVAHLLTGSLDEAEAAAIEAAEVAEARGAPPAVANANGLLAALAIRRGDTLVATGAVERGIAAVESAELEDYPLAALLYAVAARLAASGGSPATARPPIARFNLVRPQLTAALPWLAIMARLEAIRAYVALGDAAAARTLLLEIGDVLRARPDLGWLKTETAAVREAVSGMRGAGPGPWSLTTAELRLLVYLPTHLSFPEIAARMFLSPHTVKTQAISIYGKLGVSSRRGAIEKAVAAGLLDTSVIRHPGGSSGVG